MNPFTCSFCNYSSIYKQNRDRHIKIHNKSNEQPVKHKHKQFQHQQSDLQQEQSITGMPTQALNLANNIQVPPTTKQIINIQAPQPIPNKKPILHGEKNDYFDVRLKENFKLFISGPSRSGKTVFIQKLLQNIDVFTKSPPKIITLVYKVLQPIYYDMNLDHLVQDGGDLKQRLLQIANNNPMLVIFDDMINSESLSELANLFVVDGRHLNLSMVFISQKMFVNNDDFRQISQNCDYYVVFKNPRNAQEIRNLASQMTPGKMELISYFTEATQQPYSYLFINLTQECLPQVKYLSHLFNTSHIMKAYLSGRVRELIDGESRGRTNFGRMYFKKDITLVDSTSNLDLNGAHVTNNDNNNNKDYVRDTVHNFFKHYTNAGVDSNLKEDNIGTEGNFTRDTATGSNHIPRVDNFTSMDTTHMKDKGTQGKQMRENVSSTDVITTRDIGTDGIPFRHISTETERITRNDKASGSEGEMNTRDIGIDNISHMDNSDEEGTNTKDIPIGHARSTINSGDDNTEDILMSDTTNTSKREEGETLPPNISINSLRQIYRDYSEYSNNFMDPTMEYRYYSRYNNIPFVIPQSRQQGSKEISRHRSSLYRPYHTYNDEFKCHLCDEIMHSNRDFRMHRLRCKPIVYACTQCPQNFPSRFLLSVHKRLTHQSKRRKLGEGKWVS